MVFVASGGQSILGLLDQFLVAFSDGRKNTFGARLVHGIQFLQLGGPVC